MSKLLLIYLIVSRLAGSARGVARIVAGTVARRRHFLSNDEEVIHDVVVRWWNVWQR